MKLIKNWTDAWKWWSVHGAVTVAVLSAVYAAMPSFQALLSPTWYAAIMAVLGVVIVVLRVLAQTPPPSGDGLDME